MIISMHTEKSSDKIQRQFMVKIPGNKHRGNIPQHNVIYKKPTASIILNGEKLKELPLRLGTRQRYLLSSLLFSRVLEILAKAIRKKV